MDAVKERIGFKGSLKELFEFLRTDKRFYFKDGDELLAAYRALGNASIPLLPKLSSASRRRPTTFSRFRRMSRPTRRRRTTREQRRTARAQARSS